MPTDKYLKLIEKGSEIAGAISGTAIGVLVAGPIGAFGGAAFSPILTDMFKTIGNELADKLISSRDKVRVGATYAYAIEKLDRDIRNGRSLREDNFYIDTENDRSKAATILEGTLLKARDEYEEKKIRFYSNFLVNLNINPQISFEKGNTLLRIVEQLSYRQLTILSYFNDLDELDIKGWLPAFSSNERVGNHLDFFSEIMGLYNHQLIQQARGVSLGISTLKISQLGITLHELLELHDINSDDRNLIQDTINDIREIIG